MQLLLCALLLNAGSFGMGDTATLIFGITSLMLLDTSINIAMQPFKIKIGDMVNQKHWRFQSKVLCVMRVVSLDILIHLRLLI